jgi:site-specific DNA-cytosine methylase
MNVIELFSCSGGMAEGLRRAGIHVTTAIDFDENACASYEKNLGERPIRMDVRDLLRLAWSPAERIDLFVADPPCFPPGTMVATSRGRQPIETIREGDIVLTHAGRWRRVLQCFTKPYAGHLLALTPRYRPDPIRCTPEHPLLVRRRIIHDDRQWIRGWWSYADPEWLAASDVRVGDAVLAPRVAELADPPTFFVRTRQSVKNKPSTLIDRRSRVDLREMTVAWLLGLYLAEGHRRGWSPTSTSKRGLTRREVIFSIAHEEVPEVRVRVEAAGEHAIVSRNRTASRVVLNSPDWWAVCGSFGDGASRKLVPEWVFGMPASWRKALLDGYVYGDGHTRPNAGGGTITEASTVSEELAWSLVRLVESVEGVVASLTRSRHRPDQTIEGRAVHAMQPYRVRWSPPVGRARAGIVDHQGAWLPVRAIEERAPCDVVHNLEVEADNSYVAGGIAAHNCTPWSRAGKRKGLDDQHDMLLETVALVRHIKPRAFLIANVPGLDDGPNWPIVQRTIGSLSKLGYCIDFARLDAADYGVPQHRFRPFWYGHLHAELPCVQWPARTHGSPAECRNTTIAGIVPIVPWVTCRQALAHLPLKELGRPIRLRWRGANGKRIASTPDDPARVVGTSTLSDGNVLTTTDQATPTRRTSHKPSKKPRASHADDPAGTITTTNNGNGGILFDGPDHRPTSMDEPAKTITRNTHSDGALLLLPWVEHGKRRRKDVRPENDTGTREPDTLAVVPHHPPSNEDEPSRVVRATNATTPDKVLLPDGTIRESHADAPAHTIRGGRSSSERMLVSSKHPPHELDEPAGTIAGCDKQRAHVLNGKHAPSDPDAPAHVVAAKDHGTQSGQAVGWPWDRPATTVTSDHQGRLAPPGHHGKSFLSDNRGHGPNAIKLSEKAASILQGFPESWVFVGRTKRARWAQLGMAMPIGLAQAVGTSILRSLTAARGQRAS